MSPQSDRERHKAWVRAQQVRAEFKRRQWIRVASGLPAFLAFTLSLIDIELERSMLAAFPAFRDITDMQWLLAWMAIVGAGLLFQAAIEWFVWRCPACEGSLFWKSINKVCPRCRVKLTDSNMPS